MIPTPWMILGALFAGLAVYFYGHHAGYAEKETEVKLEVAQHNEEARAKEQQLNNQINDQTFKLQEANNAITEKQTALDRAIRSGRVRLPAAGCVQASAGSTAPSGDRNEAGSESDRETLAAIAAIVAQGDRNTEQLNACITAYNAVREQVNGSNR